MNDIDHLLHDAFESVRVPGDIRPHFGDMRTRARRMHRRRTCGMVGAFTLVGATAVGLQSLRHDTRAALTPGDGGVDLGVGNDATTAGPTTSIDCGIAIAPTSAPVESLLPADQPPLQEASVTTVMLYVVEIGDTPAGVATKLGVRLEDLLAANTATPDFDYFRVGETIVVPGTSVVPTIAHESTTSQGASEPYPAPCAPGVIVDTMVEGAVPVETSTTSVDPITPDTVCIFDQSPVCRPETTTLNG
ncbi:MAG: LysM peptidoglycan-binding domain-containing protein [Actinomycetota bacterium]